MLVAAYCRVSTDREDQANSFQAQKNFFKEYVEKDSQLKLYKVYADEGISGTSTKKRLQFNQMISDAQTGKFHMILTKEISRFARNTLDTIFYTRELRRLGIGVLFMTDGIFTLDADAELRLSILGSIAQEESRRTSQRVKWGQTRQMEQGVVFGHSLLGYDLQGGKLTVEPQGAEIIKKIFYQYTIQKQSSSEIARSLQISTGKYWSATKVVRILQNEKYVGDLIQKKTYTPDYLTHEKKKNNGEEPQIILKDHHEPIIERQLWNNTQIELQRRNRRSGNGEYRSAKYGLSGRIYCGKCGSPYIAKSKKRADGSINRIWRCKNSKTCSIGKTISDSLAKKAVCDAISMIVPERNDMGTLTDNNDYLIRNLVSRITIYADKRLELVLNSQERPIVFFFV